jgi:hypothetical protein
MYIVTSLWKFGDAAGAREAIERFRAGLGPFVASQAGNRFWYLVVTGADEALTITGWDESAHYEAAAPLLGAKVQELLVGLDAHVQQRRRGAVTAMEARSEK